MCYIVENDLMIDSALKILQTCSNVEIKNNSRIESCILANNNDGKQSLVTLKSGENYGCDLLVSQ